MKIAITGSHGLIGSSLRTSLLAKGHDVYRLVRGQRQGEDEIGWKPREGAIDREALEGIEAVVHLAGESIMGLWTAAKRRRIRESRVQGTALLADTLAKLERKPSVLISASAVGVYGDRRDEVLDENASHGQGFLPEVAQQWEAAATPAAEAGIRVAHPRISMVLTPEGGALKAMLPAFKLGLGGRIGSGNQYWAWITLADVVGVIEHLLQDEQAHGPFNAAAPEAVTNAQFTKTLGRVLHRPTLIPAPAFALKAAAGDLAREVLLASVRAVPRRLEEHGYRFKDPRLEPALEQLLGRSVGPQAEVAGNRG